MLSSLFLFDRHPELVSGSIPNLAFALAARWMLKQVQHDDILCGELFILLD
jgi:hypothetical protein